MENKNESFVIVLRFLLKWKYLLLIISFVAGLVAAIFTGPTFVDPKYEAYVIFYPTSSITVSKGLLTENNFSDEGFLSVGESEEAEQLLQILQSDRIIHKIKTKYNLMEHYEISKDEKYANSKFGSRFHKNVKSSLTEYTSIKISVKDKDPKMAANIANDMVEYMDTIRNDILKVRAKNGLEIVKEDYFNKKQYIQSLIDSQNVLAQKGVLNFEGQSEALSTAYATALQKGNSVAIKSVEEKLDLLSKYGPTQEWITGELEWEQEELVKLRNKYKQIKVDFKNFIPHKFIIENASTPEKKCFPRRTIITLASAFITLILTILILIFVENFKKIELN
ncbi:MAG: hypothetical protein U9R42_00795 [Bacteroidota bacterium]|nr:hypothetical protein [Bacteroidota bacterium]